MEDFKDQLSSELIYLLFDEIPLPIFYKDSQLIYRYCNKAYLEYLGLSMDQVINHTSYDIAPEHLAMNYDQTDRAVIEMNKSQYFQTKLVSCNGIEYDFMVHKTLVRDQEGNIIGIVGIMNDITEQLVQMNRSEQIEKIKDFFLEISSSILEKSTLDELFKFILEKTINALDHADFGCILTLEDEILRIVASVGYREEDVKSFKLPLKSSYQWIITNGNINKTIIINDVHEYKQLDNGPFFLDNYEGKRIQSSISAPIILDGKLFGFLNIDSYKNNIFNNQDFKIVEYLRKQLIISLTNFRLYENMLYISEHDSLTGLKNRRYFENELFMLINKSARYNESFFVVCVDLDGLKKVNDTMGHLAGDELIRYFSHNFKKRLRSSDVLSRTGGDEFSCIILYASKQDIIDKMDSLEKYFHDNPLIIEAHAIVCSFSYGISCYPTDGGTLDELIGTADNRMYQNKKRFIK